MVNSTKTYFVITKSEGINTCLSHLIFVCFCLKLCIHTKCPMKCESLHLPPRAKSSNCEFRWHVGLPSCVYVFPQSGGAEKIVILTFDSAH